MHSLFVKNDARVLGILTVGNSSITLDGNNNNVKEMILTYFTYWHDINLLDEDAKRLVDLMNSISEIKSSIDCELDIDDQPGDRELLALNWEKNLF